MENHAESDLGGIMVGRCLALIFLLLAPLSAQTAGLGRLTVLSTFGEPFHAEVELISAGEPDVASLTARLASPETYRRFNLPYGPPRAALEVSVERSRAGQPYIRIASAGYFHEPVLPLLIELQWSAGSFTRKYTALLDPPSLDASAPFPSAARMAAPGTRGAGAGPAAMPADEARGPRSDPAAAAKADRAAPAGAAGAALAAEKVRVVTRISRSAPPAAAGSSVAAENLEERARILEEEAIAGDKTLAEAKDRIARLEKTIQDMQVLAERTREAAVATPETIEAKPEGTSGTVTTDRAVVKLEEAPGLAPAEARADKPRAATLADQVAVAPAAGPGQPKPASEVMTPAAGPAPGLVDIMMTDNLPLVGGGAAVVLMGAWLWLARRRRLATAAEDGAEVPDAGADESVERDRAMPPAQGRDAAGEQIDALAEADVFIAHGREAQAVQVLEEALAGNPLDENARLKLLEVHAARKDKEAFGRHARTLHELTGGEGANWLKAAALGFALAPDDALYAAGRGATAAAVPAEPEAETLDFDVHGDMAAAAGEHEPAAVDSTVERGARQAAAAESGSGSTIDFEVVSPSVAETATDISFEVPDAGAPPATGLALDAEALPAGGADEFPAIDFNFEPPTADAAPGAQGQAERAAGETGTAVPGMAREAGLDLSGINLNLEEDERNSDAQPPAGEKDPHWHDVQEKFELVKAYQVLGAESDSVREILQDIIKEGDARQRADAKKLLDRISKGER